MGKVKLNIVGYNNPYIIEKDFDTITLKDIYRYLINKDILLVKLINCKFIQSGQLLELEKPNIQVDDTINIYIVIELKDKDFKDELIKKLFNINLESELSDVIENTLDENEIELNTDLCEYFQDKDFINLLNIVRTKPRYLEMVNSYLSHGNIVEEINFESINTDNFEYTEQLHILTERLKPSIHNWDNNKVKQLLVEFNGNVNLTARYILV